uniref:Uncharacterized protein n=1 Tax=Vespula pensylvanica TaxID=30213 RepID=A0A834UBS2_VESPE|nr:hypothetical protein H0235_005728 [Vespula pensylvanica]
MKRSVPEWLSLLPAALSDSDAAAAAAAVVVAVAVTVASSLDRRKSRLLHDNAMIVDSLSSSFETFKGNA